MRTPYTYCTACEKPFFYPLTHCTLCGQELLTRDPHEYTILGSTTVHVPSAEHTKVPYHVLRLEDEFGVTHLRKTMRQYSRGQQIVRDTPTLNAETVLISKAGYDAAGSLDALLADLATIEIPSDQRVVLHLGILPRPVGADFLASVLTFLHAKGLPPAQLALVARLPEGLHKERFLQKNGLAELIPLSQLIDLGDENHETISYADTLYDVPRPLISADLLIHLATLALSATAKNAPITASLAELFPGGVGIRTRRALDLPPTSTKVLPRRLLLVDGRGDNGLAQVKPLFLAGISSLALDRALCAIYRVPAEEAALQAVLRVFGEELEAL